MKRVESIIYFILGILFLYSLIELLFEVPGSLQDSPTYFIPLRVNWVFVFIGFILSMLSASIFPLWNVGRYFSKKYTASFVFLTIGFLGLLCWCGAEKILEPLWFIGSFLILFYLLWVFVSTL